MRTISCMFCSLLFMTGIAQTMIYQVPAGTPKNQLSEVLTRDTTLTPEYYLVEITICEHYEYSLTGKRRDRYKMLSLDTLSARLQKALAGSGIAWNRVSLIELKSENDGYYSSEKRLRKTYRLKIYGQDTVLSLFEQHKGSLFYGYAASPVVEDQTIRHITEALKKSNIEPMRQKIIEQARSIYKDTGSIVVESFYLFKKADSITSVYTYKETLYTINLRPLEYIISGSLVYSFKE